MIEKILNQNKKVNLNIIQTVVIFPAFDLVNGSG